MIRILFLLFTFMSSLIALKTPSFRLIEPRSPSSETGSQFSDEDEGIKKDDERTQRRRTRHHSSQEAIERSNWEAHCRKIKRQQKKGWDKKNHISNAPTVAAGMSSLM